MGRVPNDGPSLLTSTQNQQQETEWKVTTLKQGLNLLHSLPFSINKRGTHTHTNARATIHTNTLRNQCDVLRPT